MTAQTIIQWLWQWTWQGSAVIGLVLVVRGIVFRRSLTRWRSALWLLVLARLLLPVHPSSGVSVFNLLQWIERLHSHYSMVSLAPAAESKTVTRTNQRVTVGYGPAPFTVQMPEHALLPPHMERHEMAIALISIWLLGVITMLTRTAYSQIRFSNRLRHVRASEDPMLIAALHDAAKWMHVANPPPLLVTDLADSPAISGLLRPRLLLSPSSAESLTTGQLRNIFLHELAHLKRRDLWIDLLCTIVLAVQWFNPLAWLAFALYRSDREIARDAMALDAAPNGLAENYGGTIVTLLERISGFPSLPPGALGILERDGGLRQRMVAIMEHQPGASAWRSRLFVVAIITVGGIACLTSCKQPSVAANDEAPNIAADNAARAALQRQIPEITMDAKDLTDAVNQLSNKTGETIVIEPAALVTTKQQRIQFKLKDCTLEKALWVLLGEAGGDREHLDFAVIHGTITISTESALKRASAETRVYDIHDLLVDVPDFDDAPSLSGTPATKPSKGDADNKPMTRDEKMRAIINLVQKTVDPNSWKDYASIRNESQQLVVYQTPENQQVISVLLEKLRESRGVQVTVEARFINVDPETLVKYTAKVGGIKAPRWPEATYLDDQQVKQLLSAVNATDAGSVLSAPQITLFNGQRAWVFAGDQMQYVSHYEKASQSSGKIKYEPVLTNLQTGVLLDCQATVSSDRHYVTLTLRPQISKLQAMTCEPWKESPAGRDDLIVQVPQLSEASIQTTVSVPNQGTLLLALSPVSNPQGIQNPTSTRTTTMPSHPDLVLSHAEPTNPPPSVSATSPIAKGSAESHTRLVILVRPSIIINREAIPKKN